MNDMAKLRAALDQIADVARRAVRDADFEDAGDGNDSSKPTGTHDDRLVCTPKSLPKRLLLKAAKDAVKINPVNSPMIGPLATVARGMVLDPQRIALLTSKYWGPAPRRLTVSF